MTKSRELEKHVSRLTEEGKKAYAVIGPLARRDNYWEFYRLASDEIRSRNLGESDKAILGDIRELLFYELVSLRQDSRLTRTR